MITTRDFTFADGLTHGLVGPNGIGKTRSCAKLPDKSNLAALRSSEKSPLTSNRFSTESF